MTQYIYPKLSPKLCGFRKGHSTQYALIDLIEKWRKGINDGDIVGTILLDVSKAYDCLPHDLIIAKLAAYGFDESSLTLLHSYLTDRKQRVKIGSVFSLWKNIISGVPQGSVLGPLLFNIFLNDLLLILSNICNFADDSTLFAMDKKLDNVCHKLEIDIKNTLKWLHDNSMSVNASKFQLMFLGKKTRAK